MLQSNYSVRVLEPEKGGYLTQTSNDIEICNRVLSKKVYLAVNDSPENWKEITESEADAVREEQERAREEQERALEESKQN